MGTNVFEHVGFYRVNYDTVNWRLLQKQLETDPNKIPVANRAQILNDALELAELGIVDYNIALNLTKYLGKRQESNVIPWESAFQSLETINLILSNTPYFEFFQVSWVKNNIFFIDIVFSF